MKRYFQSIAILGLFLILVSSSALAQGHVQDSVTVTVPFAFSIGTTELSPGTYEVRRAGQSGRFYFIQNAETKQAQTISGTVPLYASWEPGQPRLVFRRYAGRHFLAQVWTSGLTQGSELPKTNFERELSRSGVNRETVAIAANQ
jgi:asparagine N-glycosylation enzyme membrane subunit Stt3